MKLVEEIKQHFEELFKSTQILHWILEDVPVAIKDFAKEIKKTNNKPYLLDLGCGTGWISIFFAKQGFRVDGIDSSKTAIELAEKTTKGQNIKNLNFKLGDALNFPYKDNTFDIVFDRGFFHHVPECGWNRYLNGVLKVLKKRGILFLSVFSGEQRQSFGVGQNKMWYKIKRFGYWNYRHFFNRKIIEKIFGKHFVIIGEDKNRSNEEKAQILYFILQKRY